MATAADVRACVVDMAEELAKVLGYTDYYDGYQIGTIGSVGGYYHPTYEPPVPKRKGLPRQNLPFKKMILYPRGVTIYHPEYIIDIESDSTYEQWIVYSRGRIADVEKQIMPLLRREDDPWPKIKQAWDSDLERRRGLVAWAKRGDPNSPTSIHWLGQHHDRQDTSTPPSSPPPPTFGDLSSLGKPSSTPSPLRSRRR